MSNSELIQRQSLALGLLDGHEGNPNVMGARAFDLLVDNMQKHGCTENVVVRPVGDRFQIVSGHHRVKAAQYLGWDDIPCAVINDPAFDEEAANFQLVRMNAIRGRLDPQAFYKLYAQVAGKYGDDLIQDMFGFADEAEFKKLITQTAKNLPKELQSKFKEAAKEVKTIDGLAKLLNKLFNQYGDTVPYGYMIVDYGGTQHVWLRMSKKTYNAVELIGQLCVEEQVSMDSVLGLLIQKVAKGELSDLMTELVEKAEKVVIPTGFVLNPTADNIEATASL